MLCTYLPLPYKTRAGAFDMIPTTHTFTRTYPCPPPTAAPTILLALPHLRHAPPFAITLYTAAAQPGTTPPTRITTCHTAARASLHCLLTAAFYRWMWLSPWIYCVRRSDNSNNNYDIF